MAKILIIEDDKFLRKVISQKLLKEGYDISEAIDGAQALKILNEEKPDLVLLDLILPELDGFEVLARMKENPELSNTPVIILSNLDDREGVDKAMKMGASDYMIKAHFTPAEITSRIESILKKH